MQRRDLLALAAAGAGLPAGAQAAPARAADFAERVQSAPLLAPFRGVSDATGVLATESPQIIGRWPTALRGRLHRNGPALMERNGERYHHWFDGDGMVQQFSLTGEAARPVLHRGRLVETTKLQAERRAGRFVMDAFATHVPGMPPIGGADAVNPANTSVIQHGGRLLALWEGGSAWELDEATLQSRGPRTWRTDLQGLPFSAHPKVDAAGHLWNVGAAGSRLVIWHVAPAGTLAAAHIIDSPFAHGMVHDMAITARHLVVPLPPVRYRFAEPWGEGGRRAGPRPFAMERGEPLRVLVIDKADVARRRVFELPAQMVFHVGNAWDTADGQVVLSYVGAPDAQVLNEGAVALMAGRPERGDDRSSTQLAQLDMASGRATVQSFDDNVEFPTVHPERVGQRSRWLVQGALFGHGQQRANKLLHAVQLLDTDSGRVRRFDYGRKAVAEEHLLIPKPGGRAELDAWLLGTTYDAARRATVLNLLDAAAIEDGPVAQAVLPYTLPLGFHGHFSAA